MQTRPGPIDRRFEYRYRAAQSVLENLRQGSRVALVVQVMNHQHGRYRCRLPARASVRPAGKEAAFRLLEQAIVARRHVAFEYRKDAGMVAYEGVAPYKLVNLKGFWYLAARDGEKLKTFSFAKIERVRMLETRFESDPAVEQKLAQEDGIWMGEEKREIVLKVAAEVAGYFKRRKLIANQVMEKELQDWGLLVSAKVGHLNQVLPIVRYWIPNLRIISPEGLQAELERELLGYVESGRGNSGTREREGSR